MVISHLTRIASLVLAFGFLFGCSAPNPYIESTKENIDGGDYRSALQSIEAALNENPQDADAHYYRGLVYYEMAADESSASQRTESYEEMRSSFESALNIYEDAGSRGYTSDIEYLISSSWSTEHNHGYTKLKETENISNDEIEAALTHLNNAIIIEPDSVSSYELASEAYLKLDDPTQAFQVLDDALNRGSEIKKTTLERHAYLAIQVGEFDKAMNSYNTLREKDYDDLNLSHGLVNALKQAGQHQKAADILEELIERSPDNPDYTLTYSKQLYKLAVERFDDWLETYREDPFSEETRSGFNEALSYAENAEVKFSETVDIAPESENITSAKAIFFQNMTAELADIRSGVSDDEYVAELNDLIDYYAESAIELFEQIVETTDDPAYYWESLFQLYSFTDQPQKADEARRQFE